MWSDTAFDRAQSPPLDGFGDKLVNSISESAAKMWGVGRAGRLVGRSLARGARGANLNSKQCQPLLKMQISALPRLLLLNAVLPKCCDNAFTNSFKFWLYANLIKLFSLEARLRADMSTATEEVKGEATEHEFQAETRMLLDIVAKSL